MDEDRTEAALRARAVMVTADSIIGTDLITVEVSGQEQDLIITRKEAEYLHWKLAVVLNLDCADVKLQDFQN